MPSKLRAVLYSIEILRNHGAVHSGSIPRRSSCMVATTPSWVMARSLEASNVSRPASMLRIPKPLFPPPDTLDKMRSVMTRGCVC